MSTPKSFSYPWQTAWRKHLTPYFSTYSLVELYRALERRDPALVQRDVVVSDPDDPDREVAWCVLGFCLHADLPGPFEAVRTVDAYDRLCDLRPSQNFKHVAAFVNWFDVAPMEEVRKELMPLIIEVILSRVQGRKEQ